MAFFSVKFILFFSAVFLVYFAVPKKHRYIWLLAASYVFYAFFSIKYVAVLAAVTAVSYTAARLMGKINKKLCLALGISISLAILVLFKFWQFWAQGLYTLFGITDKASGGLITLLAPVGISFFVLEAIGYLADVYKGKVECEKNIAKYALFLSFFTKVVSGPIERSTNLLKQIQNGTEFSQIGVKRGFLSVLWGYCLKLLIADRLSIMISYAFGHYAELTGGALAFAVILYGIQLYADFSGYSYIALGTAEMLGFSLCENFRRPYFAQDIKDFWSRWHISLSDWLKSYIYIPLGGNRKGKLRQLINLVITFIVSGIWHGTGWQFLIWGGIHGLYQVVSKLTFPAKQKLRAKINIKRDCFSYKAFKALVTFTLVDFAWLFFRAASAGEAVAILKKIVTELHLGYTLTEKFYLLNFDASRFVLLLAAIAILFFVDILHEKNIRISEWLEKQNKLFRMLVYIAIILVLIIGAVHDYGLDASQFIYAQF